MSGEDKTTLDVSVINATGLPERAYISIRIGDVRRQAPYRRGEPFHFPSCSGSAAMALDVFEKLGSKQIALGTAKELGSQEECVTVVTDAGNKCVLQVKIEAGGEKRPSQSRTTRHLAALKAKNYLDAHNVQHTLQTMVHSLLSSQPDSALTFMIDYLKKEHLDSNDSGSPEAPAAAAPAGAAAAPPAAEEHKLPDYASMAGLGDDDFPGFPAKECPDEMPDLSGHNSIMAEVLKKNPEIYKALKNKKTSKGVGLAPNIKTGMDNKGHPMIKTVGMTAGDEESYEVFKTLYDPVIDIRHGGYAPEAKHPTDLDVSKLSVTTIDPSGNYVISTRVRTGRSISGLLLPPTTTKEDRRMVQTLMAKALLSLDGALKGDYFPLAGNTSYEAKPNGMSYLEEEKLRNDHFLFQEPDSTLLLSSGMGRQWPDARGIFANEAKNFLVWVNEEDHTRLISMQMGADIKEVFERFAFAVGKVEEVVKGEGYAFMHNDHLGYVLVCPSNLGTGLRASVMVKVPKLSARDDFKDICDGMRLQPRGGAGVDSAVVGGIFDISNSDRLGKSEVELVNIMIEGCATIVKMEEALEKNEDITPLMRKVE